MKRIFLSIVAALVVVIVGYSIFVWMKAKSEVQQYCSQLTEGTSVDAAKSMAITRGLRFYSPQPSNSKGEYSGLVTSSGVMGRYVCIVEHNGKTVRKVRLRLND
jgi:hypothetical protein